MRNVDLADTNPVVFKKCKRLPKASKQVSIIFIATRNGVHKGFGEGGVVCRCDPRVFGQLYFAGSHPLVHVLPPGRPGRATGPDLAAAIVSVPCRVLTRGARVAE